MELTQFILRHLAGPDRLPAPALEARPERPQVRRCGRRHLDQRRGTTSRACSTRCDLPYEEAPGEAAFYGPKADFVVRDCIGRQWQLGTVQLDYVLPERFGLEYTGADNQPHRPVMIHRAPFGSMERFMGILIEHFAGAFPLWLAPEQVRVLPISDKFADYAQHVLGDLQAAGLRTHDRLPPREDRRQDPRRPARKDARDARRGRQRRRETGTVSYRDRVDGDRGAMPLTRPSLSSKPSRNHVRSATSHHPPHFRRLRKRVRITRTENSNASTGQL